MLDTLSHFPFLKFLNIILSLSVVYTGAGKGGPGLSVEALEKMMEDPTVQKMVYP